jgi:hypothetical protein
MDTSSDAPDSQFVVQCCVCRRVRSRTGQFRRFAVPRHVAVSHTYCPACARKERARIRRERMTRRPRVPSAST